MTDGDKELEAFYATINDFAVLLKTYRIDCVTGDRYGGEFPRELFRKRAIRYECSELPKSDLFRDLLPLLNSGQIALPRSDRLINQITGLERRVSRAGRDSIDHGPGRHDDLANAVAGAAMLAAKPRVVTGAYFLADGARPAPPAGDQSDLYAVRLEDGRMVLRHKKPEPKTGGSYFLLN